MKINARATLGLTLTLLLLGTGCNKLRARDQLNKGVQAYKMGKFENAIEHFKNAVAYDPNLGVARLYLATAYVGQYVPGVDTPDNNKSAELAIEQYQDVLKGNPKRETRVNSLKGIASLYFNMKKFDLAKEYHRKVLELDPKDPTTYYSIGVVDWTQTYQPRQLLRTELGLKPDQPLDKAKDKTACSTLKDKNQPLVDEGIDMLQKSLDLRKDYADAMAYLNLMYREKAEIDCGDPAARLADLSTADGWVEKAMATNRANAAKQAGPGGIVLQPEPGSKQ
jgi:tetratricopeptide (TPR) repeat protein